MTKTKQTYSGLEIAVVGMACKFPGADSIQEFWEMLKNGETSVQRLSKEQLSAAGVDDSLISHPDYVAIGSFVKEKDAFDHQFFKYTPNEALVMDPQIRLFHQCVWEALEDAAINPETYKLPIGIYSGAGDNFLWRAQCRLGGTNATEAFSADQLSAHEFISTLISYKLGLNGPAIYVNTACSTSLVAIHTACRALLTGELRVALAGGIRIGSSSNQGYLFEEGMILSKDGLCRAYDKNANGTVGGEGGGVVVLKKLNDAIKDGDRIYGLIKSSAVNNDGKRKIGYTAPSVDGQSECIRMAQKMAGVTPENIHFLEGHGTATVLGDSIELKAIKSVFKDSRVAPLLIGSLKTNLGHMDVGAGVGGFIKSILSVFHKNFPASLHFEEANSELKSAEKNMQVATELTPLESTQETPIRGGVSAFGIGGTNAHLIVEEYNAPDEMQNTPSEGLYLFQISAKTARSLREYCRKLAAFVSNDQGVKLQDIAYTLNRKKNNWAYRKSIVAGSKEELLEELRTFAQHGKCEKASPTSQFIGVVSAAPVYPEMGKELYYTISSYREEIDRLMELAESVTHYNLKSYWIGSSGTIEFEQQRCAYHHPLHFVLNYALLNYLEKIGVTPETAFAHSLGEYVLATKAGVFSEREALMLLHERGKLFDGIEERPTFSVAASYDKIMSLLFTSLDVISKNSRNNCLVVLEEDDLEEFIQILEKEQINYKAVNIGVPAHSRYLDGIKDAYRSVLNQVDFKEPSSDYWKLSELKSVSTPEYWVHHMRNMVDLSGEIEQNLQERHSLFIEIGGGQSLGTFIKDHATEVNSVKTFGTVRHRMEEKGEYQYFLDQLGKLWCTGVELHTDSFFEKSGRHISLPTYAWDKHRFNAIASINFSGGVIKTEQNRVEILEDETDRIDGVVSLPQSKEEEVLCTIFSVVFGTKINDRSTNFFELGGDSLKAMMCIRQLKNHNNYEITIKDFFTGETIQGIAKRIKGITKNSNISEKKWKTIGGELIPLSYNQKNYFSPLQFGEENIVLDLPLTNINKEVLFKAFIRLCERHEILRVNYQRDGEVWKQCILPLDTFEFPFEEIQLQDDKKNTISNFIESERIYEFAKSSSAFIRAKLLVLNDSDSHIILTVHHSIADGFSINILRDELFENYKMIVVGDEQTIDQLEFSYVDFVFAQADYLNSEEGRRAKEYWSQKLKKSAFGLVSKLPETVMSGNTELLRLTIEKEDWNALKELVRKEKITKQSFIQTALVLYLRSFLTRDQVVLFSTNSGRYSIGMEGVQVENLIGFFVNLVPHCFCINNTHSTSEILHSVLASFNEDLQHGAYPFEKMAEDNNWHNNPELLNKSAMFNYHNYNQDIEAEFVEDRGLRSLKMESKFLLNVICSEYSNGISIDFGVDQSMSSIIDVYEMRNEVENRIHELLSVITKENRVNQKEYGK